MEEKNTRLPKEKISFDNLTGVSGGIGGVESKGKKAAYCKKCGKIFDRYMNGADHDYCGSCNQLMQSADE